MKGESWERLYERGLKPELCSHARFQSAATILSLGLSATIKERMEKMLKKINSLKEFYKIFFIFSLSFKCVLGQETHGQIVCKRSAAAADRGCLKASLNASISWLPAGNAFKHLAFKPTTCCRSSLSFLSSCWPTIRKENVGQHNDERERRWLIVPAVVGFLSNDRQIKEN